MKKYETPKVELVELSVSDVLTASNEMPYIPYSWFDDHSNEHEL